MKKQIQILTDEKLEILEILAKAKAHSHEPEKNFELKLLEIQNQYE